MANGLGGLSDADLLEVLNQVIGALTPDPTEFGSSAGVVTSLTTFSTDFGTDLAAHIAAQAAAKSATATKEAKRVEVEAAIRNVKNVAKAYGTKESQMAELGIPAQNNAAPSTATVPAAAVNTSERLRHTLSWTDAASLDNKRKPRGVMGAEIWVKLDGPPPTDEKECIFLTLDAFTPYLAEYAGSEAGKMAHYMLRWRMRDGAVSAWGETVSATITG